MAIYGIGHMRDERLNLAFEEGTITFKQQLDSNGEPDKSFFNLLVLHQNKYKGHGLGA